MKNRNELDSFNIASKYSHLPSFDSDRVDILIKLGKDLNENVLGQMLNFHFAASNEIIEEIKAELQAKNFIAIAQLAHKFKSNSGQLGLIKLHAICNDLENLIRVQNGTEGEVTGLLHILFDENEETIKKLHQFQSSAL